MMYVYITSPIQSMSQRFCRYPCIHKKQRRRFTGQTSFNCFDLAREFISGKADLHLNVWCDRNIYQITVPFPDKKPHDLFRISYCCRKSDALKFSGIFNESFKCYRKLNTTFATGKFVNLIDNDIVNIFQVFPQT